MYAMDDTHLFRDEMMRDRQISVDCQRAAREASMPDRRTVDAEQLAAYLRWCEVVAAQMLASSEARP